MTLSLWSLEFLPIGRLLEFYETADDDLVKKCASRDRQSFVFADESRGVIFIVRPLREDPKLFQFAADSLNDPSIVHHPLIREFDLSRKMWGLFGK